MDRTKDEIENLLSKKIRPKSVDTSKIILFKHKTKKFVANRIIKKEDLKEISKESFNDNILVAPSGVATLNLLDDEYFKKLKVVAFCDLSIGKVGKKLNGIPVISYKDINSIHFKKIIITSDYFFNDILF
jgi:SepF-like predicted cell division protein (DUF552 family)